MVGVGRRLEKGSIKSNMEAEFGKLLESEDFRTAIGYRTSDEDRVRTRIQLATEAFKDVR